MKNTLIFLGGALIGGYGMMKLICYSLAECAEDGTVVQDNETLKIKLLKNKKGKHLPLLYVEYKKPKDNEEA